MPEEQAPRCGNPACRKVLVLVAGHRKRQYCNDACKMAAHRARLAAANQARYEALQVAQALREREELRQRWGDLLPETLDLLRHLRMITGIVVADQVAAAISTERGRERVSLAQERTRLIDEIMLVGEQLGYPAVATEACTLPLTVFAWSGWCGDADIEDLRQAREAVQLRLLARSGRLKLGEHT